jgi:hypothetical protein
MTHDKLFHQLLSSVKGVSHSINDEEKGYLNYTKFRTLYLEILEKCSLDELECVAKGLENLKYFNIIKQVQLSAIDIEFSRRHKNPTK